MSSPFSHLIGEAWIEGEGPSLEATDPATGQSYWVGRSATEAEVDRAIDEARRAASAWVATPFEQRCRIVEAFCDQLEAHRDELAETISTETGKPRWEARQEVGAMIGKGPISIEAHQERCGERATELDSGVTAARRFKPLGVLAVFGPFNFPGHVPNGHIIPALLAGNTVVFKPSEQTPLTAQRTAELWQEAGLPIGVLNLVQGEKDTGVALANHPGHAGILFTGSLATGRALHRALAGHPEKILALEMGGNNALIVDAEHTDPDAAALLTIQSAFQSSGQRCTCSRRLILPDSPAADTFLDHLVDRIRRVRVGPFTDEPEPFMGPLISPRAADQVLAEQQRLIEQGGKPLVRSQRLGGDSSALLTPVLIDATAVTERRDEEVFGPLLQLIRVPDFDAAIREANNTAFGLVAGLFSDRADHYESFFNQTHAGLINWNRPTTGASSRLPFGGVGLSGNHRPSGYFAADYCADPVASLEQPALAMPPQPPPGLE